jgi:fimbrial chaperone protein
MTTTSRSAAIVKVGVCLASVFVAGVLAVAQTRDNKPAAGVVPQFNITPTRLFIPKGQTSASLVLRNDGAEALRFQITAFRWSNDAEGQLVLQPTTDVVFFPMLFVVEPRQTRRVRVAVTSKAIERELSYRLFIEQLPSRAEAQPSGVQMLMRASIPLFVQSPQLVARAMVDETKVAGGQLSFVVRNVGNVHVSITRVTVTMRARGFETQVPGWYLLSGETRRYHVALPADACREPGAMVRIAAMFADNPQPLTIDHPIGAGDCAP